MASRGTYVIDRTTGKLALKRDVRARAPRAARSALPAPMILSDQITPGQSQLDGRTYDSRSALMASYREHSRRTGQEVEVVGDQTHHLMQEAPQVADEVAIDRAIKQSLEMHGA